MANSSGGPNHYHFVMFIGREGAGIQAFIQLAKRLPGSVAPENDEWVTGHSLLFIRELLRKFGP